MRAIRDAGVQLVGLNFFAGDLAGPDAGVLSIPDRSAQFRDNLDVAVGIGEQLEVAAFNALYGNRVDGVAAAEQDELARDNLGRAADAAARIGATVLVEPVSGPKPYPLRTADDAVAVVDAVRAAGHDNVGFLCDLFHLANNGDDVDAAIARHADVTSHVQIADHPGRGEPGSGALDLDRHLRDLADRGYAGWVGLEYKPTTDTETSLHWLPLERRAARGLRGTTHEHHRFHRPGHHGQPDGGPPAGGRPPGQRLQQAARHRRPARRRGRPQGDLDRRRGAGTPTSSRSWCRTPPTSRRCSPARTACSTAPRRARS